MVDAADVGGTIPVHLQPNHPSRSMHPFVEDPYITTHLLAARGIIAQLLPDGTTEKENVNVLEILAFLRGAREPLHCTTDRRSFIAYKFLQIIGL